MNCGRPMNEDMGKPILKVLCLFSIAHAGQNITSFLNEVVK